MKSAWLQVRVTPAQKALLRRRARAAGMDVSAYVLARALPDASVRFAAAVRALRDPADRRHALAAIHDLLAEAAPAELAVVAAAPDLSGLDPADRNRVAAMVEHAAHRKRVAPPAWVRDVEPLEEPVFATDMPSLRPHLLRASPVAYRRRNLFVDAAVGDRA